MKISLIILSLLLSIPGGTTFAQQKAWSLSDCINRAAGYNLQVRQAGLTTEIRQVNKLQTGAARFPTLDATARHDFAWSDQQNTDGLYDFNGNNRSSFSLNSGITLFNGFRTSNTIRQTEPEYSASKLDMEAMREAISLQVLESYLQVLYAGEQLTNSKNQLAFTQKQLELAGERLDARIISRAGYLQVKAQEPNQAEVHSSFVIRYSLFVIRHSLFVLPQPSLLPP